MYDKQLYYRLKKMGCMKKKRQNYQAMIKGAGIDDETKSGKINERKHKI